MVARLEIFCPNTPGKSAAIISEHIGNSLVSLTETGGPENRGFQNGSQSVSKESKQPRLYAISGASDKDTAVLVNYYRHLQAQGDATLPVDAQLGQIYCRDFYYQIDDLESGLYRRAISTGSTTEVVNGQTIRCGFEFPCYLLFGGEIKNLLGSYGELYDFAIYERVEAIAADGVTTQPDRSIRVAYGGFTVDFVTMDNPYVRTPNKAPSVDYSLRESFAIGGLLQGTYKQLWPITAELTEAESDDLSSLLSLWRANGGNIVLTDRTHRLTEPAPATRATAAGTTNDVSNGIVRYFPAANVGQASALEFAPKQGDSDKRVVTITFAELEDSI